LERGGGKVMHVTAFNFLVEKLGPKLIQFCAVLHTQTAIPFTKFHSSFNPVKPLFRVGDACFQILNGLFEHAATCIACIASTCHGNMEIWTLLARDDPLIASERQRQKSWG